TQCSIDPPRYAFWISRANHTFKVAALADTFAVHFLGEHDHDLAALFGSETEDTVDKFARCDWHTGPDGVPILDRCPTYMTGRRHASFNDDGDHVCFVVTPTESHAAPGHRALMFSAVQDIDAGHDPRERQRPEEAPVR